MKTVSLTPFEIKMIEMSLNHQWFKMTNDNGNAVNCEQKSADCVYDLLRRFETLKVETEHHETLKVETEHHETLKVETEHQGVREHLESLERIWCLG